MSKDKIKLKGVFCHKWYTLHNVEIDEIYIMADGNGPMGYYDRVHIISNKDENLIFPAHHCEQMQLLYIDKDKE